MIAVLDTTGGVFLPAATRLFAQIGDVPFAVAVVTCVCHRLTWTTDHITGRLVVVPWFA